MLELKNWMPALVFHFKESDAAIRGVSTGQQSFSRRPCQRVSKTWLPQCSPFLVYHQEPIRNSKHPVMCARLLNMSRERTFKYQERCFLWSGTDRFKVEWTSEIILSSHFSHFIFGGTFPYIILHRTTIYIYSTYSKIPVAERIPGFP